MSRITFSTEWRKSSPPFGGFTPPLGGEFFYGPFLCLAVQILRCGLCFGKREIRILTSTVQSSGRFSGHSWGDSLSAAQEPASLTSAASAVYSLSKPGWLVAWPFKCHVLSHVIHATNISPHPQVGRQSLQRYHLRRTILPQPKPE